MITGKEKKGERGRENEFIPICDILLILITDKSYMENSEYLIWRERERERERENILTYKSIVRFMN